MNHIEFIQNIDIGNDKISDKKYQSFQAYLAKELDFYDEKMNKNGTSKKSQEEFKKQIQDFLEDFSDQKKDIFQAYEAQKKTILKNIGLELSQEKQSLKIQTEIYKKFDILPLTYENSIPKQFAKGIIDSLIIGNAEIIEIILEKGLDPIYEMLQNLISVEGIKSILHQIGESFFGLFSGNAYEMGKSSAECIPLSIAGGVTLKILKSRLKQNIKTTVKKQITKITAKEIQKLNKQEIIAFIKQHGVQSIDFASLSSQQKSEIYHIIAKNFPLLEVTRLTAGDHVVNISMGGIKAINDELGQEFCDKVSQSFHDMVFSLIPQSNSPYRVIKKDVKNLTLASPQNTVSEILDQKIHSKKAITQNILSHLEKEIKNKASEIVYDKIQKGSLPKMSKSDIQKYIAEEEQRIKNIIQQNINYGIGKTIVENGNDLHKIEALRQAEISSRPHTGTDLKIQTYSHEITQANINKALSQEKEIIKKYSKETFSIDGKEFPIVIQGNQNARISSSLLRYMRKSPEKISPPSLVNEMKNYMRNLNQSLDYIAPVQGDIHLTPTLLEEAYKINHQLKHGTLDAKYLTSTFKGSLSKEAFFQSIVGKKGVNIFIDIKDMGVENFVDFSLRAKKIQALERAYAQKNISQSLYQSQKQKLFLEAGTTATQKFLEFEKRLKQKYPNIMLSFGGDEIFAFLPNGQKITQEEIQNILKISNLKARISLEENIAFQAKNSFSRLDKFTKINKSIEEFFDKNKPKSSSFLTPEITVLDIKSSLAKQLENGVNNIDNTINSVINTLKQTNALQELERNHFFKTKMKNGIFITLSEKNGQIHISLA